MRRSKYDIMADVLKLCQDDASITEVIYKSNLSHKVGKSYLAVLMEAGFVVKLDGRYHTTWLGTQFLRRFEELQEVFSTTRKLPDDCDQWCGVCDNHRTCASGRRVYC